jgi:hypothetical protein
MGRKDSEITVLPQEKGGYAAELKKVYHVKEF